MARQPETLTEGNEAGLVDFAATGDQGSGAFRCSGCGYGVVVTTVLPSCPMCSGTTWEREPWHSFGGFAARAG